MSCTLHDSTLHDSTLHDSTYMLTSPIRASKGLLTSWRELNRELFGKRHGCNGYGKNKDGEKKLDEKKGNSRF